MRPAAAYSSAAVSAASRRAARSDAVNAGAPDPFRDVHRFLRLRRTDTVFVIRVTRRPTDASSVSSNPVSPRGAAEDAMRGRLAAGGR